MLKNLLYLIDTRTFELIVTLFTVTVNKNGELILRFVRELGALVNVNDFVEDSFVAVMTKEFQSKFDTKFAMTLQSKDTTLNRVAYNTANSKEPFEITILGKGMKISKSQKLPEESEFVVSAVLETAILLAKSGVNTIMKGDATHIYEIYELQGVSPSLENLPKESDPYLYNLPRANLYKNLTAEEFGEKWKNSVMETMNEFFLTGNEHLIPSIDGQWRQEYVEGTSFPYMKFFSKIPSFEEWKGFFNLPLKFLEKPLEEVG